MPPRPASGLSAGPSSGKLQQALGLLLARDRKRARVEQADLEEQRRLVPVDVLVGNLPSVKPITTTVGIPTLRPVGARPGSMNGISGS
jgi:hypothetical protein